MEKTGLEKKIRQALSSDFDPLKLMLRRDHLTGNWRVTLVDNRFKVGRPVLNTGLLWESLKNRLSAEEQLGIDLVMGFHPEEWRELMEKPRSAGRATPVKKTKASA